MIARPASPRHASGVALVTVLLVVAIVTTVCAGVVARQHLLIRLAGNQLHSRQAWHYALGGERLALAELARDGRERDHRGDAWAARFPSWPVEGGAVAVRVEDLAGRFNLNALVRDGIPDTRAIARFKRLLQSNEIDPRFAARLADWVDPDSIPTRPGGAEDAEYLRKVPAHRAANRPLQDVSELRLLGLDDAAYRRLAPHVAALPGNAALNINTADAEVLAALASNFSPAKARAVAAAQDNGGFSDVGAFLRHPAVRDSGIEPEGLAVASAYYLITSEVIMSERRQVLASTVRRASDGTVRVLRRDLGHNATALPTLDTTP